MNHRKNTRYIFDKYAASYREKYLDQGSYAGMLDHFLDAVPERGRVLDLGCGPGNISRYLLDRRPDLELEGIDLAPAMIMEAASLNPEARFVCGDAMDLAGYKEASVNGIVSGFLLPYLEKQEVKRHLESVARLLVAGGVCYLSFLEDNARESGYQKGSNTESTERLYMNFYPVNEVTLMVKSTGFTIVHTQQKTPRSGNGEPTNNEIIMLLRSS